MHIQSISPSQKPPFLRTPQNFHFVWLVIFFSLWLQNDLISHFTVCLWIWTKTCAETERRRRQFFELKTVNETMSSRDERLSLNAATSRTETYERVKHFNSIDITGRTASRERKSWIESHGRSWQETTEMKSRWLEAEGDQQRLEMKFEKKEATQVLGKMRD